ncbi:MAG: CapA family protein [Micrococcaceae bacterium]
MNKKKLGIISLAFSMAALTGCGVDNTFKSSQSMPTFDGSKANSLQENGNGNNGNNQNGQSKVANCQGDKCTSVFLSGDVMNGSGLWDQATQDAQKTGKSPRDYSPMVAGLKKYTATSDASICHFVPPVATASGPFTEEPVMNVPPEIIPALKNVGYSACNTSSEHSNDQGTDGIKRTVQAFKTAGLQQFGTYTSQADANKPHIVTANGGAKIALITTTSQLAKKSDNTWQLDSLNPNVPQVADFIKKAQQAKQQGADIVIVSVDGSGEGQYITNPTAAQKKWWHQLLDNSNIDMVVGYGTHSVLPIENYNGKWAIYGLGNSINDNYPNADEAAGMTGLSVRAQFTQKDGKWTTSNLAWVPSTMGKKTNPYRWCSLATDKPQGTCIDSATDTKLATQIKTTVNSMGASSKGAQELSLKADAQPSASASK